MKGKREKDKNKSENNLEGKTEMINGSSQEIETKDKRQGIKMK